MYSDVSRVHLSRTYGTLYTYVCGICNLISAGSTAQVTFPPGAGHDRYEENFNGPATYAEPYVERYGIKSDFSGREPLHPTPPRPGYVPTLGQTPPSSTQGSVMMVYGLQPDKVNTDKLFNLFCLYGNVTKVRESSFTRLPLCDQLLYTSLYICI